jgi:transcriptional regulator with XRE-family HTH domain
MGKSASPSRVNTAIRTIFADNLRRLRIKQNLTQEELAHGAGINRLYVSAIERGMHGVSIDILVNLANVLGVSPSKLLTPAKKRRPKT